MEKITVEYVNKIADEIEKAKKKGHINDLSMIAYRLLTRLANNDTKARTPTRINHMTHLNTNNPNFSGHTHKKLRSK